MTVIKDGTGQGFLTKVDEDNHLSTRSVAQSEAAHISIRNQKTFSILGQTTTVAAVEKTILVVINNSSELLAVDNILVSLQGESGKPAIFRGYVGQKTFTSGGTAVTPVNLNVTSTTTIDTIAVENNPTLGGSDTQALKIFLESTGAFATDFDGIIILGQGGSIRVTVEGDAAAVGKIALSRIILFETHIGMH